jgi:hypothetical protein
MGPWRRKLSKAALVGLMVAIPLGGGVMYLAWGENLSMTIRDGNGTVDWVYWLMIGASWAVPAFVIATAIATVVLWRVRSQ